MVNLIIANTEYLSRRGLQTLINEQTTFNCVATVTSNKQLTVALSTTLPNVLIIDYCCSDCFSLTAIKKIKTEHPTINILVMSHEKTALKIKEVIATGIKNYILKSSSEPEIIEAINCCANGAKYFSKQIIDVLLEEEITNTNHKLTARELAIVNELIAGKKPFVVADHLAISYHTVIAHKRNIYKKLGINTNVELMQYAITMGIWNKGN